MTDAVLRLTDKALTAMGGPAIDADHPGAEKEPQLERLPRYSFETAPRFLERVEAQPPPSWLMRELLPDEGIAAWHGRPRTMKSLCALEGLLSASSGVPAFGSQRFASEQAVPAAYVTDEDGERLVAQRLRWLLAGQGWPAPPDRLHLMVRAGLNLEANLDDQDGLIRAVEAAGVVAVCLDPTRACFPSIDKGPADAAPAIRFLRRLQNETAAKSILLVHHDVKPGRDEKDARSRAERASGGAIFSIADCPVNFERVDERTCFAVPTRYKFGADPKPFRVRFESETEAGEPFRGYVRAVGETVTEADQGASRVAEGVLQHVSESPGKTTGHAKRAVGGKGEFVVRALARLEAQGRIRHDPGPRGAKLWYPA